MTLETPAANRSRDAAKTRQLLLDSARRRFAHDGYSATTVRDIAADAGVNVALINRYFTNKVGLFKACLMRTSEELGRPEVDANSIEQLIHSLVTQVAELPTDEHPLGLLLLLRSSGDEQADEIRRELLHTYTVRMAAIGGWRDDDPSTDHLLIRAQVVIASALGIVMLRASTGLEPLTSAGAEGLAEPLGDVVTALLGPDAV
jgi:AcrR family transcriptional regulator